tara:strand:+ start:2891 stop:3124 length:234 start_codon:yes stop_codon:yes gene_type:complete
MLDFLMNEWVVGATLLLIGLHQFNIIPFFGRDNFGSMEFISLPVFGAVTPLRILGVAATVEGAMLLYDCCRPMSDMM